jgi:NADP-dependent 3-hydroxy acid dehydrogenase YdfG
MAAGFIESGHIVFGCARSESSLAELRKRWPAPHRFEQLAPRTTECQ